MKENEKSYINWYFLIIVLFIYVIVSFFDLHLIIDALGFSVSIFKSLISLLALMFFLMLIFNYYLSAEQIIKYLGESAGIKKWLIAMTGGILSSGPIYMWYPLLSQLHKRGVGYGVIATFLYNRAIKLPLLPILISYFGFKYVIVLMGTMLFFSLLQGLIIQKIKFN